MEYEVENLPRELSTPDNSFRFATVFRNRLSVVYSGLGLHDEDIGVAQANKPAPIDCLAYYFEIHVKNAGVKGQITIGFSRKHVRMSGVKVDSCSYHGHNGLIYRRKGQDETSTESQTYTTNDTVGCGINYASQEFFFTKNGALVGKISKDFTGPLYPTVSLHSQNEEVNVNFGREGFAFDFKGYVASEIDKETLEGLATEIAVPPTDIAQEGGFDEQEVSYAFDDRKHLRELIMKGEIDAAIDKLRDSYPQLLQDDKSEICFLLGCQKFIELVRKGADEEAMKYGREELAKFIGLTSFKDILEDCFALLVYERPEESTVGYLLGETVKEVVVDAVNAEILSTNPNKKDELVSSRMERLARRLTNCSRELHRHQGAL